MAEDKKKEKKRVVLLLDEKQLEQLEEIKNLLDKKSRNATIYFMLKYAYNKLK